MWYSSSGCREQGVRTAEEGYFRGQILEKIVHIRMFSPYNRGRSAHF